MLLILCVLLIVQAAAVTTPLAVAVSLGSQAPRADGADAAPTAEIEFANNTDVAVTAWAVDVVAKLRGGASEHHGVGTDGYIAYAGVVPEGRRVVIWPHASLRWSEPLSRRDDLEVVNLHATLRYAVFADGSWVGDPQAVREQFARRARSVTVLQNIVSILRNAQASAHGRESLELALSSLVEPARDNDGYGEWLTLRQALRWGLDGSPNVTAAPDDLLAGRLVQAERRLYAAEMHCRQGPQRVAATR